MKKLTEYPKDGCLYVTPVYERAHGPTGHRFGNPARAWVVYIAGEQNPRFEAPNARECRKWAEDTWPEIDTWRRLSNYNMFTPRLRPLTESQRELITHIRREMDAEFPA